MVTYFCSAQHDSAARGHAKQPPLNWIRGKFLAASVHKEVKQSWGQPHPYCTYTLYIRDVNEYEYKVQIMCSEQIQTASNFLQ